MVNALPHLDDTRAVDFVATRIRSFAEYQYSSGLH